MKPVKYPTLWTAASVAVATFVLYQLTAGMITDAVDGIVISSLSSGERTGIVLALYVVVIGLSFTGAVVGTLRSYRAIAVAAASVWCALLSIVVIAACDVFLSIPGYPISSEGLLLIPAYYAWLETPLIFLVTFAALLLVFMMASSKISGVN